MRASGWVRGLAGAGVVAAALAGATSAEANLVQNSSFEDDGINWGTTLHCPVGGWTLTTCDGATTGETTQAVLGLGVLRSSYLAVGSATNAVSQILGTVAGGKYLIQFDYSGDDSQQTTFDAYWDGNLILSKAGDGYNPGWSAFDGSATYSFQMTASSSATEIKFVTTSADPGSAFVGIDDVSVEAVSEPAELGLFGLGLVGLGAANRRRRRAP